MDGDVDADTDVGTEVAALACVIDRAVPGSSVACGIDKAGGPIVISPTCPGPVVGTGMGTPLPGLKRPTLNGSRLILPDQASWSVRLSGNDEGQLASSILEPDPCSPFPLLPHGQGVVPF